jgi:hypothetical protein
VARAGRPLKPACAHFAIEVLRSKFLHEGIFYLQSEHRDFRDGQLRFLRVDRLKEQLVYLKFWQGIMIVTDISLVGWLVSTADGARAPTVLLAIVGA